jgi:hypothetical protein
MSHRCTGDVETCGICGARRDAIEWGPVASPPPFRVSLRKPLKPMSYARLMEICREGRERVAT